VSDTDDSKAAPCQNRPSSESAELLREHASESMGPAALLYYSMRDVSIDRPPTLDVGQGRALFAVQEGFDQPEPVKFPV